MNQSARFLRENIEMVLTIVIIGGAIAFMLSQGVRFTIVTGTIIGIYAILGIGLNLVIGYTGLLSVAHIGFFGIGAYTVAVLTTDPNIEPPKSIDVIPAIGMPWFAALPIAIVLTGIVALLAGFVFNRFRDDVFALTTFGFALIAPWRFPQLAPRDPRPLRDPGDRQAVDRDLGLQRTLGIPGYRDVLPGCCAHHLLVNRSLVLRSGANSHPGGRAGHRGVRLQGHLLQAGGVGNLGHDCRPGRRADGRPDRVHRAYFLRAAGIDTDRIHRDNRRAGKPVGVPCWGQRCSSCWKKECVSYQGCLSALRARPGGRSSGSC